MGLKGILFLGCFLAAILISSEVTARELAETSNIVDKQNNKVDKTNDIAEEQYLGGGFGGYPGGGFGGYPRGGGFGGFPGGRFGGYPGGGYPRGGGGGGGYLGGFGGEGCPFGCCGPSYFGRGGCTCCSYARQAVDAANSQNEPQN